MHYSLAEHEVPRHIHIHRQLNSLQYQVKVLLLFFYNATIQHIYTCWDDKPVLVVKEGIGPSAQTAVQIQWGMSRERRLGPFLINLDDIINQIKNYILLVARALRNPMRLPWLLKDIFNLCIQEEDQRDLRLCLIRVQVEAELLMTQDIQRYQQRRYVAQVIEILLFNELLLAPREPVEEGEIE